jgi:hypothetical protein
MLKSVTFEINTNLNKNDIMVFSLVRQNDETQRFEVKSGENNKAGVEMIQGISIHEQTLRIEADISQLIAYQETNLESFQSDAGYSKAFEDSLNYISSKAEQFFDDQKIDEYFYGSKKRVFVKTEEFMSKDRIELAKEREMLEKKKKRVKPRVQFYQDASGSNTYLHELCLKYINLTYEEEEVPLSIKGNVVEVLKVTQSNKLRKQVK